MSRLMIVGMSFLGLAMLNQPVMAQFSESEFQRCTQIISDQQRLKCFDNMNQNKAENSITLNEEVALAPKSMQPTVSENSVLVEPAKRNPINSANTEDKSLSFGEDHLKSANAEEEVADVQFTVKQVDKLSYDNLKITFENGQVWQQKDSNVYRLKPGNLVTLSRGFGSAVYLQKDGKTKKIRVRRIK